MAEDIIYMIRYICTKDSKHTCRGFQFKFLHRQITTNDFLYNNGAIRHNICTFCSVAVETLEHLLWECSTRFLNFFPRLSEQSFSLLACLGLISSPNILIDHNCFSYMARYHIIIYISKIKDSVPKLCKLK